ncbi:hypothetical protein EMCRGX_G000011 [Ephydatia muelleri]
MLREWFDNLCKLGPVYGYYPEPQYCTALQYSPKAKVPPKEPEWVDVFKNAQDSCPNVLQLVDLLPSLPASSADCEQGFSLTKVIRPLLCSKSSSESDDEMDRPLYVQEPEEETVRALARRCGSMYRDLGKRQSGHWPGNVAVLTGTWGGDSQGTGLEMWQYVQEPEEETVRALARRCGSTHRDLGRRQSGHWPGDVAVWTWGGDSQGTGQEMWQYVQEPEEETVRALARRCGSMYRDLGRRQSGHWPGNVAVLTGTWGGDSQGTGPEMWQYVQEPEEETVRALARRCGSTHRDLGRRQSGHWPGDVAVCTGTWGGDSQDIGQEMWQYSQGPGEETVRALARRCGSMYRNLGRRQSGHWPGNVAVLTRTWGGDSQGTGQEMWQYSQGSGEETVRALARRCGSMYRNLKRRQSGHWPGDVAVCTGTWGGDSQGTGQEMWQYSQGLGEETVRTLARRCGSMYRDLGRRQSGHWPGDVAVCTRTWGGDSQGTGQEMWQYS